MSNKTDKTAPAEVYINPNTMQVVGEGYPNAVRYIREDVVKETKKLTAKDLMIWDYMKYKDGTIVKIARVGDVSPMDAPIYCYTQLEGYFPCELADLAPIPLTAEILEKNGWTKPASGRVWDSSNVMSFVLEEIDDGSFEVSTDTFSE